jgi:hypothetical protein
MSDRAVIPCPKCGQPMAEGRACPGFRPVLMCTPPIVRKPQEIERHIKNQMEVCAHYGRDHSKPSASGIGGKIICAAGIPEGQIPHRPLPCVTTAPCAKKRLPTRDEVLAKMRERDSAHKGCGHMLLDQAAIDYVRALPRAATEE